MLIFKLKHNESLREFRFGVESKNLFCTILVNIFPLESGLVDPHIFEDPDPGSQHAADSSIKKRDSKK